MKTLYNSKRFLATAISRYGRVLSLMLVGLMLSNTVSAEFYLRYNNKTNENNPTSSDFEWSSGATPVSDICTWTISCKQYQNTCVFFAWPSASTGELKSIVTTGGITKSSSKIDMAQYQNYSSKNYLFLKSKEDCSFKIEFNQTSQAITISDADTPTPGGDMLPVTNQSYAGNSPELFFYITGFGGSTAKYKNTDTYTLTVESGTAVISGRSDTGGQVRLFYTLSSGFPLSGINVFKLVHEESGDCAIVTFNNLVWKSTESCSSPTPTTTVPSIRIGKKAVVNGTDVTFNGQIADWGCANVTGIKVKYSKNGGAAQTKSIATGLSINSNTNTGDILSSGWESGEYTYTLIATNSVGDSEESDQGVFEIACTTPTKAQYTMATGQSFTYDGASKQPTVSVATGAGDISSYSYSTDKSNWASTAVNVGTYYVKINVSAGTQYCAANDIVLDNTFAITKADQAAFSISNETTTFCKAAAPQVTTTGGSGTGAVTFSKDSGTDGITVNASSGQITANNAGTITVKATKAGGTNYRDANATKVFTINAEPAQPGTISGNASPCVNATGLTYSITEVATATGYTWTVPAGWSITAGAGTRSITATAGTAGGNITVKANNDCGSSAVQTLSVTVKGKAITVSPTTVSAKKYTPTDITATTEGESVTWAVTGTNNYLLNADKTVYTSGNVKQVTVKAVSSGTVTATTTNDGCETSATVTLSPSDDTETCN